MQTNGPFGGEVHSFTVSGTNLFAGTYGSGVFLSTNNGTSWTAAGTGLPKTYVYALAVSGTNIFAGTPDGVFRSTNNGTSWTQVNTGLTNIYVQALAVSGSNLFAGTNSGGVFLSTDNGTSWSSVNTGLPLRTIVRALAVSPNGANLFVGTWDPYNDNVFLSTDNGTSWTAASTGLKGTWVYALAVSGTNLFAGTILDGVWRLALPEILPASVSTAEATNVNSTSATLNGSVNPNGVTTTARFEWGMSSNLSTYSTTASEPIGSGTSAVSVTANLTGLSTNTTYYYRVVGQNSAGTERGSILSFTTLTLQQQTQLIIGQVGALVSAAVLNPGQGNALTVKLNGAIQKISEGDLNAAINKLGAFINQVEGLVRAGNISSAEGDALISSANAVIAQLSAPASNAVQNLALQASEFDVPTEFLLEQNYPNPFNPETQIGFQLPEASHVVVRIFNMLGQEIRTLADAHFGAGYHTVRMDGKDNLGNPLASGMYLFMIQAGKFSGVKKMSLVR
jgi:hypothetical protein